jgi:alkylation response protein AidB-like acyl-CoA dehydrogenase
LAGWVERARRFAETAIRPHSRAWDREDRIPDAFVREMGREGFLGLTIAPEYGGAGLSTIEFVRVIEELSAASGAAATMMAVDLSVAAAPIQAWGTEEQKRTFLPRIARGDWIGAFGLTEPSVGSDSQHLSTRYQARGDGWRLDGAKTFITNAASAEVVLIFATRDPGLEAKGISCFLVRKGSRGFSTGRRLDKLGIRGSETVELLMDDCDLPRDALLGPEGEGFKIAMTALEGGRIGIAACSLGMARAALEETLRCLPSPAEDWQRSYLARSFVEVEASRALVERAAEKRDRGEDFAGSASAAKLFASQAAFRIASRGLEAVGRKAFDRSDPCQLEQLFRDARVLTIVEGTTEVQELILGRRLLGKAARPGRK